MFHEKNDAYQVDAIGMEYLDGLYSYALVLSRDQADAEDLVQETYVRAVRTMGGLRADSKIKSCFFTILRNIWLNQLHRRRTAREIVDLDIISESNLEPAAGDSTDPHTLSVRHSVTAHVREAIDKLPSEFREIVFLREYEDLSYQEISTILDCPADTLMSRLARARSRLRILLAPT